MYNESVILTLKKLKWRIVFQESELHKEYVLMKTKHKTLVKL